MKKCPACEKPVTGWPGLADVTKHLVKCAEHEQRWLNEGKMVRTPHLDYLKITNRPRMVKPTAQKEEVRVFETVGFTLDGITVFTAIDYEKREVSLVDRDGKGKQWLFTKRTPDYFNGWQRILSAMKYAIEQAEARLEAQPSLLEQVLIAEAERDLRK